MGVGEFMVTYDIVFFLDENYVVENIEYWNHGVDNERPDFWNEHIGKKITEFLNIDLLKASGYISWKDTVLRFIKTKNIKSNGYIIYVTNGADNGKILERALDNISEGIQIFDQKGNLIFCNKSSEKIEKTDRTKIIGKHLLDIYDLNEEYSTILNTIKKRKPIINRYDNFKNKNGEMINTMNTGYPLFINDTFIGAVGVVQDNNTIDYYDIQISEFKKKLSQSNKKNDRYYTFKYYNFDDLIGETQSFKETIMLAKNISNRDCSVLIYGETGTGKELFAQSMHSASNRKGKEFIAINCAAIPETLTESILFGTEKGSFTGSSEKIGLFEQANEGTLFLDEINSMSIQMQSKLLRVLQEKKFRRLGGLKDIECDVRIISSINENPYGCLSSNKIRKDLFYRVSTVTLSIPPLRDRIDDIEILVKYFIEKLSKHYSMEVEGVENSVMEIFRNYDWPGNVRELLHVIEYSFNTMHENIIMEADLPRYILNCEKPFAQQTETLKTLQQKMDEYECEIIRKTLKNNNYNITKAADELGIMRQSLQYRMKKYKL